MRRSELTSDLAAQLGARHEARFIVEDVLGVTAGSDAEVTPDQVAQATALTARRRAGEPLQYVLGHWSFRELDLLVDPRVLIPRPETEQVVEVALVEMEALATSDPLVVDAGTGSGAIALSLSAELARRGRPARVFAIDASADALAVAQSNLARQCHLHQDGTTGSVTLLEGSWLDPLPLSCRGAVDLVVSNPPYVTEGEWAGLGDEVKAEPRGALVAQAGSEGTPGLADVEAVLIQSLAWLARPGVVVIELAPHQAAAGARVAQSVGYDEVEVAPDLTGRPRALIGRLSR
ncbi:MAG TPA: peptide chain release factor N(5)-glutamine methyltransferase [Acidimicrobiales bacterium]